MARLFAASFVVALTVLAIASAPPGLAAPGSSAMAAEFPVGRCIDVPDQVFDDVGNLMLDGAFNLSFLASVPCTDPARDYRVVAQVPQEGQCGPETNRVFITRDVVTLCTVQDPAGLGVS